MDQKPSIGRIVHFNDLCLDEVGNKFFRCRAAIVTDVIEKDDNGKELKNVVSLRVFEPNSESNWSVIFFEEEKDHHATWHWPERI